ncbi:hypothetical protein J3E07_000785 [Methanococcus voltae]|uniref:Uncharacterized protein n=1 Tax=Methanococcus voltae TaxID=2188 RepID=A0A8J7UR35_METVO|nr:hypothetical protein [Methanococcus voltae]MBP2201373.1 hypothetical protein [Methanococcus voltae]
MFKLIKDALELPEDKCSKNKKYRENLIKNAKNAQSNKTVYSENTTKKVPNDLKKEIDTKENMNSFDKGKLFEKYVENILFPKEYFDLLHKTPNYEQNNSRFVESSLKPDFMFRNKKTGEEFYVECKFRNELYGSMYKWAKSKDQMDRYRAIEMKENKRVFIAMGLSGTPEAPEYVFLTPLKDIKYISLYPTVYESYEVEQPLDVIRFLNKSYKIYEIDIKSKKEKEILENIDSNIDSKPLEEPKPQITPKIDNLESTKQFKEFLNIDKSSEIKENIEIIKEKNEKNEKEPVYKPDLKWYNGDQIPVNEFTALRVLYEKGELKSSNFNKECKKLGTPAKYAVLDCENKKLVTSRGTFSKKYKITKLGRFVYAVNKSKIYKMISKEDFELLKDYKIFYKLLDDISYYKLLNNMYELDDYLSNSEISRYVLNNRLKTDMINTLLTLELINYKTHNKSIFSNKTSYKLSDFGKMVFEEYKKDKGYR